MTPAGLRYIVISTSLYIVPFIGITTSQAAKNGRRLRGMAQRKKGKKQGAKVWWGLGSACGKSRTLEEALSWKAANGDGACSIGREGTEEQGREEAVVGGNMVWLGWELGLSRKLRVGLLGCARMWAHTVGPLVKKKQFVRGRQKHLAWKQMAVVPQR